MVIISKNMKNGETMKITYKRVPFWNGMGFLLSIPNEVYPKVSDALSHTVLVYGNGKHIRAYITSKGWIVYLHVAGNNGPKAGFMTKDDLERYLAKVCKKMSEFECIDGWVKA